MKRPASAMGSEAKPKAKAKKGSLQLGCKSCRGSPNGCKSCRNPNFAGWRGTAKEFYAQGGKAPNRVVRLSHGYVHHNVMHVCFHLRR